MSRITIEVVWVVLINVYFFILEVWSIKLERWYISQFFIFLKIRYMVLNVEITLKWYFIIQITGQYLEILSTKYDGIIINMWFILFIFYNWLAE